MGSAENSQQQFEVFRTIHNIRDFRLVLCADVPDCIVDPAVEVLECLVKEEKNKGGLDYLLHEPLIISERRTPRTRCTDPHVAWSLEMPVYPSAL